MSGETSAGHGAAGGIRSWIRHTLPADSPALACVGSAVLGCLADLDARSPHIRLIVFEARPSVAKAAVTGADCQRWLSARRLEVLTGPDYHGVATLARRVPDLHKAVVFVDRASEGVAASSVTTARQMLDRARFQASANEDARRESAGRYLLQTLANATRIAREGDAGALFGLFPDTPAIIAAAGPSLDTNVHDIAPVRDRAIVIACDTAARTLLSSSVVPDFIVASDSSRANSAHLSSLPASRSWLVAEPSVHASSFVHFDRRTFTFKVANHQPWPWLSSIGLERTTLESWGSVATSAFSLALALGCNPIVFAGADFAFTGDRPYCRGTSFEAEWATWVAGGETYPAIWKQAIDRWPVAMERDVDGRAVRTAPHLVSFRDWVVDRARLHADRRLINATRAGILAGAHIELGRALDTLWPAPVLNREAIDARIEQAHASSRGDLMQVVDAIDRFIGSDEPEPFATWHAFTAGTTSLVDCQNACLSSDYLATAIARQALLRSAGVTA